MEVRRNDGYVLSRVRQWILATGVFDRGRKNRLISVLPPSEPCRRISRTRLSSWWFYLEEDWHANAWAAFKLYSPCSAKKTFRQR
jgi:hypothetical protein